MTKNMRRILGTLSAVTLVVSVDALGRPGAGPGSALAGQTQAPEEALSDEAMATLVGLDRVFAALDESVGGFGGAYLDENGHPTVLMEGSGDETAALEALRTILEAKGVPEAPVHVRWALYGYRELAEWRSELDPAHSIPGVAFLDIDEASNRLRIGVEDDLAGLVVEGLVDDHGVPRGAVEIVPSEPFVFGATLQSKVRPIAGGLQIAFGCSGSSCYFCTAGFSAIRAGVAGFVTNSHCSQRQGGAEATIYSQPYPSGDKKRKIGVESLDPTYFTGGTCPSGRRCRYSDSLFVQRTGKAKVSHGTLTRPTGLGSTTISESSPTFRIVSEDPGPVTGETVNKIGRSTGWSQGKVTSTCVNVNVGGTDITLLCQDLVSASATQGDSGSPVFRITSGTDVSLYGVLWGVVSSGSQFAFSRLSAVQRSGELGSLGTCDPSRGC